MSAVIVADNIRYGKPNMAALEGDWGREIFESIRDTPRADFAELDKRCAEVEKRISEAKRKGTF